MTRTLPQLFRKFPSLKNIPVFKYLKASNITEDNYKKENLHQNIVEIIEQDISVYKITLTYFEEDKVLIQKIFDSLERKEYSTIDLERFSSFLSLNKAYLKDKSNVTGQSYYKKMACLYDRLKYGWFF